MTTIGPTRIEDAELDALVRLAEELADAAGAVALAHFRAGALVAHDKGAADGRRFDPVTEADRGAERAIRVLLNERRPNDGVFGEEEERTHGTSGLTWIVDPIDGTRSFISGLPLWGTLIALDDGTRGRIGVIDQPYMRERFVGVLREGGAEAWMTGLAGRLPLHTRRCAGLAEATVFTTDPFLFSEAERAAFETVRARARLTRYGTDCYAYALLAMGLVDLVIESGLAAYDVAALVPVVTAAGGRVTGWRGEDCRWGGRVVAAGSPEAHEAALEVLSRV
jgi:histidinol phosphatase-like enzyme (inositol monophosphatase family)